MPELTTGQYSIGDLLMGKGTPYIVSSVDPGSPDLTSGDVALVGEDGFMFGRDTIAGAVIAIDFTVDTYSPEDGRARWRELQSAWRDPSLRVNPLMVTTFGSMYQGGTPVVAFGRPRKLDLADGSFLRVGRVDLQSEFQAVDWKWYSQEEHTVSLRLIPSDLGSGITWPVTFPVTWGTYTESLADVAINAGTEATWPVVTFRGPVVNPSLEFLSTGAKITFVGQIKSDQFVTLDTRPWGRSVINQTGGSVAGKINGSRLSEFSLPPGNTIMKFSGTDNTGSSRADVVFRDAYPTL